MPSSRSRPASIALSTLFGVVCFVYRYLAYRGLSNDHFVHLSRAQQILLGELPVRDFLDPGLPLQYVASAVAQVMSGRTLLGEVILVFGCLALAAALTFRAIVRLTGSYALAAILTLLQILILPRSYGYPKLLLYPLAVVAIDSSARSPGTWRAVVLAVLTVAALLMRYDHGVFIAAGCVAAIVAVHWRAGHGQVARAIGAYGLATAILILPYALFVQTTAGLAPYARQAIAFSEGESERLGFSLPTFALQPRSALTFLRREATIYIAWRPRVGAVERASLEHRFGLIPDSAPENGVWRYRIGDVPPSTIREIVEHPAVGDTGGVDRGTFTVNADRFANACVLCVEPGPGMHAPQNAEAWLFYLPWATCLAAVVIAIAGAPDVEPVLAATTVLMALTAATFLRAPLSTRLADVWGILAILLAVVIRVAWDARRVVARALCVLVLVLTGAAVAVLGGVREEFAATGLTGGWTQVSGHVRLLTRELSRPIYPAPARPDDPAARSVPYYVMVCTRPSDRVLAFTFMPELFYSIRRGFAAGYVAFVEGAHVSDAEQELALARWRRQSVPFAVVFEREYPAMARSFPLVAEELNRRYEQVYKAAAQNDRGSLVVYAERGRRVLRTYEPLGTPCFAP